MNSWPLFFILTALGFFSFFAGPRPFRPSERLEASLPGYSSTKGQGEALWQALVTGEDRGFTREEKRAYYRLGLGHLFTPSGVHLATLNPIIKRLPIRWPFYGLMTALMLFLPAMGALARVAWVKTVPKAGQLPWLFCGCLLIEGFFFSWRDHGLSWTCSWMFLGLSWFAPPLWRTFWFIVAQMLLCWVLLQPFSLLAPLINILMALPLFVLFPFTLVLSFIPHTPLHELVSLGLQQVHHAVMWCDRSHEILPAIRPHAGHIAFFIAWICCRQRRWSVLLLVLLSNPTGELKLARLNMSRWEIVETKNAQVVERTKTGVRYSDGVFCRLNLEAGEWRKNCRPPKRATRNNLRYFH